jgi:nicotinamide riboside kinase
VCAPDLAFVPDTVRYAETERAAFFERLVEELSSRGRRFVVVEGSGDARLRAAVAAVDEFLAQSRVSC